jgi:membrane-bound lytic murein transglycosylase B
VAVGANRLLAGLIASSLVVALAVAIVQTPAAGAGSPSYAKVLGRPWPAAYDPYVRQASACPGLDPLLLVAIHDVETRGDAQGDTSSAGAIGPMQFLPSTWDTYGFDANGDGVADPWNVEDALAGATHLLCANGAAIPGRAASAVWNYNHSWDYVNAVLDRAATLRTALSA